MAMQELVHRNWKEFLIAPKTSSFGKAEQLRGLPKSSIVVRNVASIDWRRRGGMVQWLASLSDRPCGLKVFVLMVAGHEPQKILGEVRVVVESGMCLV